jgi:hypothetical protein
MIQAANSFRAAASDDARRKSLIRWYANFAKQNPPSEQRKPPWKPFSKIIEETLGISAVPATRMAITARNLTEDQVAVLASAKATDEQVYNVAALGKGAPVDYAISLIASGAKIAMAIAAAKALKPARAPFSVLVVADKTARFKRDGC